MSEQKRRSCVENGELNLCEVNEFDKGVHFCDRTVIEEGVKWTLRRAVNFTAVRKSFVFTLPNISSITGFMAS